MRKTQIQEDDHKKRRKYEKIISLLLNRNPYTELSPKMGKCNFLRNLISIRFTAYFLSNYISVIKFVQLQLLKYVFFM